MMKWKIINDEKVILKNTYVVCHTEVSLKLEASLFWLAQARTIDVQHVTDLETLAFVIKRPLNSLNI